MRPFSHRFRVHPPVSYHLETVAARVDLGTSRLRDMTVDASRLPRFVASCAFQPVVASLRASLVATGRAQDHLGHAQREFPDVRIFKVVLFDAAMAFTLVSNTHYLTLPVVIAGAKHSLTVSQHQFRSVP